jgi:hypothetical protein
MVHDGAKNLEFGYFQAYFLNANASDKARETSSGYSPLTWMMGALIDLPISVA